MAHYTCGDFLGDANDLPEVRKLTNIEFLAAAWYDQESVDRRHSIDSGN
ncbi:MAG: hypothetical protein HOI67_09220 [Gammaproteobacteria bacterium]|nr:hypothetical protein [Gammaproteobacteria bacterium]